MSMMRRLGSGRRPPGRSAARRAPGPVAVTDCPVAPFVAPDPSMGVFRRRDAGAASATGPSSRVGAGSVRPGGLATGPSTSLSDRFPTASNTIGSCDRIGLRGWVVHEEAALPSNPFEARCSTPSDRRPLRSIFSAAVRSMASECRRARRGRGRRASARGGRRRSGGRAPPLHREARHRTGGSPRRASPAGRRQARGPGGWRRSLRRGPRR